MNNAEMLKMRASLKSHLDRTDLIGYAAARNTRILGNELLEFENMRDSLIEKYGEQDVDEEGNLAPSFTLRLESENYPLFDEQMSELAVVEHDPTLFKIKYEDVVGKLSGTEILEVDWMLED